MLSINFNNKKCAPKFVFFNEKKLRKILMIFKIENWLLKLDFGTFDTSSLHQFSKFNNFLWVRWFLGKNLSNFVSRTWKLGKPYCHIDRRSWWNSWTDFGCFGNVVDWIIVSTMSVIFWKEKQDWGNTKKIKKSISYVSNYCQHILSFWINDTTIHFK